MSHCSSGIKELDLTLSQISSNLKQINELKQSIHSPPAFNSSSLTTVISPDRENAIRNNEATLVRLFSRILFSKLYNESQQSSTTTSSSGEILPAGNLEQWLEITSVASDKVTVLKEEIGDVIDLLQFSSVDLVSLSDRCGFTRAEKQRFIPATLNLKAYTKSWLENGIEPIDKFPNVSLGWFNMPEELLAESFVPPHRMPPPVASSSSLTIASTAGTSRLLAADGAAFSHQPQVGRRSLSVSESGVDSGCASDSGGGSTVSQTSLPTATPPPSPGFAIAAARAGGATGGSNAPVGLVLDPYAKRRRATDAGTVDKRLASAVVATAVAAAVAKNSEKAILAGEMARSRSHESDLQIRLIQSGGLLSPTSATISSVATPVALTATAVVAASSQLSASSLSLGRVPRTNIQSPPAVGSGSAATVATAGLHVPAATVRKSATFSTVVEMVGGASSTANSATHSYNAPMLGRKGSHQHVEMPRSPLAYEPSYYVAADVSIAVPPKSPRGGPIRLDHKIKHRFNRMWKMSMDHCHFCRKVIGIGGEKCQDCRMKIHLGCKDLIDDCCGFTTEQKRRIYDQLLSSLSTQTFGKRSPSSELALSPSPLLSSTLGPSWSATAGGAAVTASGSSFMGALGSLGDSASSSSCNSSAPSTPAFAGGRSAPPPTTTSGVAVSPANARSRAKFTFPDTTTTQCDVPFIHVDESEPFDSHPTASQSSGDATTIRADSAQQRQSSLGGAALSAGNTSSLDSQGSTDSGGHQWQRNKWTMSTIRGASSSWREWSILYEDLKFPPEGSLLGRGRFGEVHRAYWHQDVAVKMLNMDHVDDERQLEAFKQEVSTFRNTRHENLVLFVGYCLIPPRLGIVMNLCKGQTLYTHIHIRRDRFDMNRIINMAIQISQGVSYLHGKKILHKDLRSKNVFVESKNKVVITDFSLFSVKRLCLASTMKQEFKGLYVPERWLCYLAPEIMRELLTWHNVDQVEEPVFSEASDVYSFGSLWYEMLTYEFPYKKQANDAIVWQCCKGIKPSLNSLPVAKEIKDILMQCWTYKSDDRPNFQHLLKFFEKLPRKRLERSPSQPVHLSRSAESVF